MKDPTVANALHTWCLKVFLLKAISSFSDAPWHMTSMTGRSIIHFGASSQEGLRSDWAQRWESTWLKEGPLERVSALENRPDSPGRPWDRE